MTEISTYQQRIRDLNTQVSEFLRDIPAEGLNWRPPFKDVNSLAALASHIAGAELSWIVEIIGHQAVTRDRELEFETIATDADELIGNISVTFEKVEEVLKSLTDTDLDDIRQVQNLTGASPLGHGTYHRSHGPAFRANAIDVSILVQRGEQTLSPLEAANPSIMNTAIIMTFSLSEKTGYNEIFKSQEGGR